MIYPNSFIMGLIRKYFLVLFITVFVFCNRITVAVHQFDCLDELLVSIDTENVPQLGVEETLEIKRFLVGVKQRLFSVLRPQGAVTLQLLPPGSPAQYLHWKTTIELPYDFPTRLFRSMRSAKLLFRRPRTLIHEYAHAVTAPYLMEALPELREYTLMQLALYQDQERFKDPVFYERILALKRFFDFAQPYDEVMASLAVVLYYDDSRARLRESPNSWLHQLRWLSDFIISFGLGPRSENFDFPYRSELNRYFLYGRYNALGPSRSAIWRIWSRKKSEMSPAQFFFEVFQVLLSEMHSRAQRADFENFDLIPQDNGTLMLAADPVVHNQSLIGRLNEHFEMD